VELWAAFIPAMLEVILEVITDITIITTDILVEAEADPVD